MGTNHNPKRRAAGVASAKIVITSASVAATLGGWAAIGAMDTTSAASPAQNGALAQAPAMQDTQTNTAPPFGRGNRWGDRGRFPAPGSNGAGSGLGGTAPQQQPQQDQPQAQPQQQPQLQTMPRVRTRSSR